VRHLDGEQLRGEIAAGSVAEVRFEGIKAEVVRVVEKHRNLRSASAIANRVTGRRQAALAAIRELVDEGQLVQIGGDDAPFRRATA
jgi:hypothetical protein